ncbi:MAG: ACP S-malonyltransferase [Ignavibacteriales bacterium]|nr:ACP S-malonyltransferase [Ignavibacteriales bacterium]
MTICAYIFPGQGSQYVGMGKDLYEKSSIAREFFKKADDILSVSLSKICFDGPEDILKQTVNTQPAIFLHSMVLTKLMNSIEAAMVAGHSLGEYTALVVAGALTFEDGLKLVRLRGSLMQHAGEKEKGTMAAIVGLNPEVVIDICNRAGSAGIVQCANFNSPGQIVVSGSVEGVQKALEFAKDSGAKMAKELIVSGAFHSPLMKSAHEGLQAALAETMIRDAKIPVYANVTGKPVQKAEEIRTLLSEQLTNPVLWEQSINQMVADGTATFVEIGPGKVLQGLVKRTNSNVAVRGIEKFEDVKKYNGAK